MSRFKPFLLGIVLLTPLTATGQSVADDAGVQSALKLINVWLSAQRDYQDYPGLSAAIVHDQELLWSHGYGFSNLETQTPTNPETIYSICSISKLFTSVALMRFRDEGAVRMDDPVSDHLSWLNIKESFPDDPPITVGGILTHSSGLPRESDFPYWSGPDFPFPTRDQLIERVSSQSTLYPADTYFQYSNLGLSLAGEIVAEKSGQPYSDYIQNLILTPLELSDTRTKLPEDLHGGQLAIGYSAKNRAGEREAIPIWQARGIAPAAGFSSTVLDLAKFSSWQFRVLGTGHTEILSKNTLREMHRVHWLDSDWGTSWGWGFRVLRQNDKTFVGHGGACPGYRTNLQIQTDSKISTIVMVNSNGADPGLYTRRLFEIVEPAVKEALDSTSAEKDFNPEFEKFTGIYSGQPWGGDSAILNYRGKLVGISLSLRDPIAGMTKLKHIEGNTFRRIRDNEELGEEWVFEEGADGDIVRVWQHSHPSEKIE